MGSALSIGGGNQWAATGTPTTMEPEDECTIQCRFVGPGMLQSYGIRTGCRETGSTRGTAATALFRRGLRSWLTILGGEIAAGVAARADPPDPATRTRMRGSPLRARTRRGATYTSRNGALPARHHHAPVRGLREGR